MTGGGINLQKSFWVLMAWKWKEGLATLLPPSLHAHSLELTAGYNINHPVKVLQMSPYDSYRTLGAYISPSGGMGKAYEVLRGYSMGYAMKIQDSALNKEVALWSYLSYFLPKVTFPLPAMTLTATQCYRIQSPALQALLPKIHLNRNTARSIIHGPLIYGGMNISHLYTTQSLLQLKFLVGHLRAQEKMSKLLLITHGTHQVLIGKSANFLSLPYNNNQYFNCRTWLCSVWQFMDSIDAKIDITQAWLPPCPRKGDCNLMDYFTSQGHSTKVLMRINRCRVYLRVLLLSDMVSAIGRRLIPTILTGKRLVDRRSMLQWPDQGNPSKVDWEMWATALWM